MATPNILHFIFGMAPDFGGKRFGLVHYLAIRSAWEVNRPNRMYFHYSYRPEGEWWERIAPFLVLDRIEPPTHIFGQRIFNFAHKADIVRLVCLIEMGGIYLDLDTICVRPFAPLLGYRAVLGEAYEGTSSPISVCSAVVFAEKDSFFMKKWLEGYSPTCSYLKGFFAGEWDTHSSIYPYFLSKVYPETVHVEPSRSFFWPNWQEEHLRLLFEPGTASFPEAYSHHLWEGGPNPVAWSWRYYLENLTVNDIRSKNSPFERMAARFIDKIDSSENVSQRYRSVSASDDEDLCFDAIRKRLKTIARDMDLSERLTPHKPLRPKHLHLLVRGNLERIARSTSLSDKMRMLLDLPRTVRILRSTVRILRSF